MNKKIDILGVHFDAITMEEATKQTLALLEAKNVGTIYTANPEIVMAAQKNAEFCNIINKGDLVVADGIGVVIGSKIIKKPLPERVAGYDLVQNIFKTIKSSDKTVYFFGAAPGVAQAAAEKMQQTHKGLKIVGFHDGYFDGQEELRIIEEIKGLSPDLLLVGLGAPRQELWISKHKDHLNIRTCIGVGGSFDVMSGQLKRAPKIFIKLGLEWFHRLVTQPKRFKRMIKLPFFLVDVFVHRKQYM